MRPAKSSSGYAPRVGWSGRRGGLVSGSLPWEGTPSPAPWLPRQVVRVYCYVTVVSLQYLTPLIFTLHCTLLLKTLGEAGPEGGDGSDKGGIFT